MTVLNIKSSSMFGYSWWDTVAEGSAAQETARKKKQTAGINYFQEGHAELRQCANLENCPDCVFEKWILCLRSGCGEALENICQDPPLWLKWATLMVSALSLSKFNLYLNLVSKSWAKSTNPLGKVPGLLKASPFLQPYFLRE